MPLFRIHMINSEFESCEDCEYASLDAAQKAATGSAMRVASESIAAGEKTAAVEVRIEEGGHVVVHHVVNVSISPLLPDQPTATPSRA